MRRATMLAAACAALTAAAAPAASAAVDRVVYTCQGTGTWTTSINLAGSSTVARSISAPVGACKKIHAGIADDGNLTVRTFDTGDAASASGIPVAGVGATGVPAFAGVITGPPPLAIRGPIVIAGNLLNATVTAADATPWTVTEIHTGDGSCGTNCYRTKVVWVGTYSGNQ